MFYGGGGVGNGRIGEKGRGGGRSERFEQMSKQQEIIEQKKREIEAKMEAERQKKAMEALVGKPRPSKAAGAVNSSSVKSSTSVGTNKSCTAVKSEPNEDMVSPMPSLPFANDGSFIEQFRRIQEQKVKDEVEVQGKAKIKEEPAEGNEYGTTGKKPYIKLISPQTSSPSTKTSAPPSRSEPRTQIKQDNMGMASPSNSYSAVPPPPPPPPPPSRQREREHVHMNPRAYPGNFNNAPPPPPPPPPPSYPPPSRQTTPTPGFPSLIVRNFAATVAEKGDRHEDSARSTNNPLLWFLSRPDSEEYRRYRDLVLTLRSEKSQQGYNLNPIGQGNDAPVQRFQQINSFPNYPNPNELKREADDEEDKNTSKKRRSRWGPQDDNIPPPSIAAVGVPSGIQGVPPPIVPSAYSQLIPGGVPSPVNPPNSGFSPSIMQPGLLNSPFGIRTSLPGVLPTTPIFGNRNPQLLNYARQSYGTVQLDEEQWKQCEEAYKMNLLFQDIARKKAKDEKLAQTGKFKYEYDSDEEVDDQGTWEHKKRLLEMEKTKGWAEELTTHAKGKHHLGDFLPPEELAKFMDKYKAVKEGKQMTQSAYEDFKIAQDNVGFKLLQKMGWVDGQGLGASGQGITAPIDKGTTGSDKQGLGLEQPDDVRGDDDEYAAYRKRMMLAYRFRPNPLNNPRRAYY